MSFPVLGGWWQCWYQWRCQFWFQWQWQSLFQWQWKFQWQCLLETVRNEEVGETDITVIVACFRFLFLDNKISIISKYQWLCCNIQVTILTEQFNVQHTFRKSLGVNCFQYSVGLQLTLALFAFSAHQAASRNSRFSSLTLNLSLSESHLSAPYQSLYDSPHPEIHPSINLYIRLWHVISTKI